MTRAMEPTVAIASQARGGVWVAPEGVDRAAARWSTVVVSCFAVWLIMRLVFFTGLVGSDDLHHVRYAALWDRAPANHWEARLLANGLMALSFKVFGRAEWVAALPSLLASLGMLACVLYYARRVGGVTTAWWAGMTLALLPTDVARASSISAFPVMLACLTAGTVAWLQSADSRRACLLGGILLGFGMLAHLSAAYYVAALFAVSAAVGGRGYFKAGVVGVALCAAVMALEVAVYHFAFDDAFARFRLSRGQFPNPDPNVPLTIAGVFNWRFITWPIQHLIFSKGFGFIILVALGTAVLRYSRLGVRERILLGTVVVYWLWISFGSVIPWAYSPFWRMMRFVEPVTLAVVILFASAVASAGRRWVTWAAVCVLGLGVLILSSSGSWGQNVRVSGELLAYAQSHPRQHFITDYHTWNEMYALNAMAAPANVATLDDIDPSQLLDRDGARVPPAVAAGYDAALENPLNVERSAAFTDWLREHRGPVVHETAATYRRICQPFTALRRYAWAVRKPPARVVSIDAGT